MLRRHCVANRNPTSRREFPISSVTIELNQTFNGTSPKGRPFAITDESAGVTMDNLSSHLEKAFGITIVENTRCQIRSKEIRTILNSISFNGLTTGRKNHLSPLLLHFANFENLFIGESDTNFLLTTQQPYQNYTLANGIKDRRFFRGSITSAEANLVLPGGKTRKKIYFVLSLNVPPLPTGLQTQQGPSHYPAQQSQPQNHIMSQPETDIGTSPNLNADADFDDETNPSSFVSQLEIGSHVSHIYKRQVSGTSLLFWECVKVQEIHKTSDQVTSIVVKRRPGNPIYWYPDSITDATDHFDHPDATTETISDLDSLKPMPSFN